MRDYTRELAGAKDFAAAGATIARGHYGRGVGRKRKADGSWVTEADWAAEAQIRLRIARTYPDHNILGEEEGLTRAGGGPPLDGAPTWVVDPIDGTHNYMAGIPVWATLVALQIDGATVAGVCNAPALGEVYEAALGSGARMNGEPIAVEELDRLEEATVLAVGREVFTQHGLSRFIDALVARSWRSRGFGEFWGHMLVARGAAHVMVEPELNLWDVAPLGLIASEAGGLTTHLDGTPWGSGGSDSASGGSGSALTTNGVLHDEIVELARITVAP